jgi:hypothetical protein
MATYRNLIEAVRNFEHTKRVTFRQVTLYIFWSIKR